MKAKTSATLYLGILFLASQPALLAQGQDCYDIQCPSKILVPCEGPLGAHAWYSVTATTICAGAPAPTITYSVPPGSLFPPGTNVVCAVIQIPGMPARQCCWDVIVDGCCPTNCIDVICPSNIVVGCQQAAGPPGAFVDLPKPRATNECGDHILPATLAWRCFPEAPTPGGPMFFPPGTNTVVCCLTEGANLQKCCSFQVIVTDCPPVTDQCRPRIICPKETQVQCEGPDGAIVFFPPSQVIDPCGLVVATKCTRDSGTLFPNGKTTVACCITWNDPATGMLLNDCCTFDVVVRCCPPTNCVSRMACPQDMTVDCPPSSGLVLSYPLPFGTNTCEPTSVVCDPPPGSIINGPVTVCCKLLTSSGNVLTQCCFNVKVIDITPPSIDCPPDITVISPNCQPMPMALPIVTAKDDCDPHPTVTCAPLLNLFPCGTTKITCTATDAAGNSNQCSFAVTVVCQGITEIICPPDMTFTCTSPTGLVVNYTVTATNPCAPVTGIICVPASGSVFLPGTTTVCCHEPNSAAAPGCCFKVTVVPDDIPPQITCPSNIVVMSPNCSRMEVLYPAPTASDNCQLDSVSCKPSSGSPFPLGTTVVTCCATDKAGNSNCCSFTVTVRCPNDCIKVVCPSNIVVDCAGPNGALVNFQAYAIDDCTGGILPVICSRAPGSFFPPGTTTVCCTNATAGALQWCCFDVTVKRDTEPPVINCSSNIFIFCARPNGVKVNYNVTASDNCDPSPTITCVPPSGSLFRLGCSNVTCVAVDNAGNASTCTFKVCVLPQGCYLRNPSFEQVVANAPLPTNCGDPIGLAVGWTALSGTPDLFRPPFASMVPGNCRGQEDPCHGTNYAGLEGGYTASGAFMTEEMMGTLIAPLNNGQMFRLRACLSLAESSPGPVLIEFVLANSAAVAQQKVIHQVMVTQKKGWMQYLPPCFRVPEIGNWDRLIIRASQVSATGHKYPLGYVYVDNVNICCCKPILRVPVLTADTVTVTWDGAGQLQATDSLNEPADWRNVETPVLIDPDTGEFSTRMPRPPTNLFFRIVGPDLSVECAECGG